MKNVFLFGSLLWCFAPTSAAMACTDRTQTGLTICYHEKLRVVEKRLNRLLNAIPKNNRFYSSQKAWELYVESDCKYAHHSDPRGSMYTMETSICKARHVRDRIEILRIYKKENF
jgi:uncharacterized protein YecT (DUF1311 family)